MIGSENMRRRAADDSTANLMEEGKLSAEANESDSIDPRADETQVVKRMRRIRNAMQAKLPDGWDLNIVLLTSGLILCMMMSFYGLREAASAKAALKLELKSFAASNNGAIAQKFVDYAPALEAQKRKIDEDLAAYHKKVSDAMKAQTILQAPLANLSATIIDNPPSYPPAKAKSSSSGSNASDTRVKSMLDSWYTGTDVVGLSDANFKENVLSNDQSVIVNFYFSDLRKCRKLYQSCDSSHSYNSLKSEWISSAMALNSRGVKVSAVDCILNKATCDQYLVRSLPTIKLFSAKDKTWPVEYTGKLTASAIVEYVLVGRDSTSNSLKALQAELSSMKQELTKISRNTNTEYVG